MHKKYNVVDLSNELGVDLPTLKRKLIRKKMNLNSDYLPIDNLTSILNSYSKERKGRSAETVQVAKRILEELIGNANVVEVPALISKPKRKRTTKKKVEEKSVFVSFFKSEGLLFVVFISALLWQMAHTSALVSSVSPHESVWYNLGLGILFAFAVQFTALLMTIHTGNIWYLKGFAIVDFSIIVLHHSPWQSGADITEWAVVGVLAASMAFTIFSYSELFVTTEKEQHGTI